MLLMEYCNDVEQCNPCAKSREGSWHGSMDVSPISRGSHRKSKLSLTGSSDSVDTARGPGVACLVAEAVTSEALCAAPGDTSFLCGSTYSTSQIDGGLPATFAGSFKASKRGEAQAFLKCLGQKVRELLDLEKTCKVLEAAIEATELPDGCEGAAVAICNGELMFSVVGHGLVALSHEDSSRSKTELLAGLEERCTSERGKEGAVGLDRTLPPRRKGFGSIIPVDRSSLTKSSAKPGIVSGECHLTHSHEFLLLAAGPLDQAFTPDQATAFVDRARSFPMQAMKGAPLLASECNQILNSQNVQDPHVAIAVLHFKPPLTRSPSPNPFSGVARTVERPTTPPKGDPVALSSLTTSPSRRVHFVQPFPGTAHDVSMDLSAFADAARIAEARSASREVSSATTADSAGLLSSNSTLSRPNMSIPEDQKFPDEALQLPPPLLPPIRKAYPSSSQLVITPEMLSSPSPARKAKLGRAASFNSPNGLWPLPPQRLEKPLRQTSSTELGVRGGGGAEGRVRGGIPRVSSNLSVTASLASQPSTASLAHTPSGSRRQSFETQRSDEPSVAKAFPEESEKVLGISPWGLAADSCGRKAHGKSQALRLLKSSKSADNSQLASVSAPANLTMNLSESLARPLSRELSSGTESVVQSLLSGSSGASCRVVRRVPVVRDTPQEISAAAAARSRPAVESSSSENQSPVDATQARTIAESIPHNDLSGAASQGADRRVFSDLNSRSSSSQAATGSPDAPGQPIPMARKASFSPTPSLWPEIDSAAATEGLLKSMNSESRQHSGVAFLGGSLPGGDDQVADSLADSVDSLSLKAR